MTAIHSGTVAMTSAARPLGIVRSAQATPPLPQTISKVPTIAAARHCVGPGRSPVRSPRRIAIPYKTLPATRNRSDVARNVGNVSFTTRIAKYVVLQMTYTAPSAIQIIRVEGAACTSEARAISR